MLSGRTARADIPPLTALRAIGALWVVFYHFDNELRFFRPAWIQAGYLGVDLFFVLSGFVVAYSYADDFRMGKIDWRQFLALRLARIYPMHFFSLTLLLVMYAGARSAGISLMPGEYSAAGFAENLLLVQSWGVADRLTWNYPSWSISTEWFLYLGFPLVAAGLSKIPSPRLAWAGWLILFAVLTVAAALEGQSSLDLLYGWSLLRGGCEFLMGALLWTLFRFNSGPSLGWSRAAAVVALAGLLWFPLRGSDFIYPVVFSVVVFAASRADGLFRAVLSSRAAVYIGTISYSIYMTHILVRKLVVRWVHLEVPPDAGLAIRLAVFGLCVALAIAVGAVCFHGLEDPARRALRRFAGRSAQATA